MAKKEAEKKPAERISRRWLVTLWPEHLPPSASQPIPIDSPEMSYYIDADGLASYLRAVVPHFRAFAASVEVGEEKQHEHVQGYLELTSPVRKSALIKGIGVKHYYEACNGSQEDCLDYVYHTGTHIDKPGLIYTLETIGRLALAANSDNHETTLYNVALAMVLEGKSIVEVSRACGIGISRVFPMLNALAKEVKEERRGAEIHELNRSNPTDNMPSQNVYSITQAHPRKKTA